MAKDKTFGVVLVAGLVGAAVGLLFAPKSGKETREDLRKKALEAKDAAADTSEKVLKVVQDSTEELRGTLQRSAKEMTELGEEAKIRASRIAQDARNTAAHVETSAKHHFKKEERPVETASLR